VRKKHINEITNIMGIMIRILLIMKEAIKHAP